MGIFTDLVLEQKEIEHSSNGVSMTETAFRHDIKRTDVRVGTEEAAKALGKKIGDYITVEARQILNHDNTLNIYLAKIIAKALKDLIAPLKLKKDHLSLVVGIGNRGMTPDALGAKTVDNIIVTRHFYEENDFRLAKVAAIAPGVLGKTGIETQEVIFALTKKLAPSLVIVVDSLASRKTDRIATTFQLGNTGLTPGGGINNHRPSINFETLGVPVIAVGVPFVVDARTMGFDVAEALLSQGICDEEKINVTLNQVITKLFGELIVTPKDIDRLIDDAAFVVSLAINIALHSKLTPEDVLALSH